MALGANLQTMIVFRDAQENKVPIAIFPIGALLRAGGALP